MIGVEQFELGHARGASHDHTRIIRRSYHTPGYVRLAGAALRRLGPGRRRRAARRPHRRHRPLPRRRGDLHRRLHDVDGRGRRPVRSPRRRDGHGALAAVAARAGRRRALPGRHRDGRGRAGDRGAAGTGRRAGRPAPRRDRGDGDPGLGPRRDRLDRRGRDHRRPGGAHRRRLDQRSARRARLADPPRRDPGAADLHPARGDRRVLTRAVPGLDLDGRAELVRLPRARRARPG